MSDFIVTALLWFLAIGCGLMAGIYFAFSVFIMSALQQAGQVSGIAAMNAINRLITRSLFMPLFLGTTLASVVLVVLDPTGFLTAVCVTYVVGMFICTLAFNVPLNNALAAVDASSDDARSVWAEYLSKWTRWNHVRTGTSTVTAALYVTELIARA